MKPDVRNNLSQALSLIEVAQQFTRDAATQEILEIVYDLVNQDQKYDQ